VNALAGILGERIINLPDDARPGRGDWAISILDKALVAMPPEGSA
jgi:hypothetical protein